MGVCEDKQRARKLLQTHIIRRVRVTQLLACLEAESTAASGVSLEMSSGVFDVSSTEISLGWGLAYGKQRRCPKPIQDGQHVHFRDKHGRHK